MIRQPLVFGLVVLFLISALPFSNAADEEEKKYSLRDLTKFLQDEGIVKKLRAYDESIEALQKLGGDTHKEAIELLKKTKTEYVLTELAKLSKPESPDAGQTIASLKEEVAGLKAARAKLETEKNKEIEDLKKEKADLEKKLKALEDKPASNPNGGQPPPSDSDNGTTKRWQAKVTVLMAELEACQAEQAKREKREALMKLLREGVNGGPDEISRRLQGWNKDLGGCVFDVTGTKKPDPAGDEPKPDGNEGTELQKAYNLDPEQLKTPAKSKATALKELILAFKAAANLAKTAPTGGQVQTNLVKAILDSHTDTREFLPNTRKKIAELYLKDLPTGEEPLDQAGRDKWEKSLKKSIEELEKLKP